MKNRVISGAVFLVICVLMWCCVTQDVWGKTPNFATNQGDCPKSSNGGSCSSCPTETSKCGTGCAWVKINAGPMRPGSAISQALFRMGENQLSEAVYTPQTLSFVAGYAMKGISHELTSAGAPRQVTLVQGGGIPFIINFKDDESIGVPTFGDAWVMKLRLFMVDANGWTTLSEPAYYDLYTGDGERYRFNAFKTSPQYMQLVSHRTVAGREETYQDMGVEVIRDASQSLRQVLLPSRLADIVVTDSSHYAIKFYTLASMAGGKDTNGCHQIISNAAPFETWSFSNPEPGTLRKLLVTRNMGGRTTIYDYTYVPDSESWTMTSGDGINVTRQEEDGTLWNDALTERLVTRSVKAGDGFLANRYVEQIKTFRWGDGVTRRVTDTGNVNLTNSFTYNAAGMTESAIEPDGSWRWYKYDNAGRVINEISAFKDSALTSDGNAAHEVLTSYTPVDTNDNPRLNDQLPRTVTESILGTVVSKTFRAYRQGNNREFQEIVEKTVSPVANYGAVANLRTVTTYYGTNMANHQIGRIKSVVYPDGRMDTYTYDYGAYQPGAGEIQPSFEVNSASNYWCETIIHGTVNNPEGLADKTTKEKRILDPMSQQVLSETWVCSGGANYDRVAWTSKTYDEWQHPILVKKSDGEKTEASWGGNCCGKEWEIGPDGTEINYGYDLIGRMISMTKKAATTDEADLVANYTYDSEGRRLTETRMGGTLSQPVAANVYDRAGRLISATDGQGIATTYGYNGTFKTMIQAGLTNTTVTYLDGQSKLTTENGVVKSFYDYGVNADGTRWAQSFSGPQGNTSPSWQKTTTDLLGRSILAEKPGYEGAALTNAYYYNSKGQLIRTTINYQPSTIFEYDEMGQQARSGLDINKNGVLDLAGPDRVTESATWFGQDDSGDYWQCRASILYAGNNSATPTTNNVQKTRITGLGASSDLGLRVADLVSLDILGNATVSRTYINHAAKTVTQSVTAPDSTNAATQVTINGLLSSSTTKTGVYNNYGYDALGRQISAASPSPFRGEGGGEGSRIIASYTHYNALGQVDFTMDGASNRTAYAYDAQGRRTQVTDALSNTTYSAYDVDGRVLATWGATYPVAYDYDDYGRMTAMYTYRGSNSLSSYSEILNQKSQMDQTRWLYDLATGLLTNKLYADGHGPAYTYTADGKLLTRTWARGVVTTYAYDVAGQLETVSYSDNTPSTAFSYDRLGHQTTITDGTGSRTFTYNDALQLAAETNTHGVLQYAFDILGRPAGFDSGSGYSLRYSYDAQGRFSTVSNYVGSFSTATYSYVPGADLISGYTTDSGFAAARSYEPNRNLITSITNSFGGVQLRRFDYLNDAVGRRVQRADYDLSVVISNLFAYNMRSELEDAVMGTNQYNYAYDPIGNRRMATNNAEALSYVANSLNQYSQISNQTSLVAPAYDLDGNMTGYKDWTFVWDAENRLVLASNTTTVVSNSYDYMSRRVAKVVNGQATAFAYQGWAMFEEATASSTNSYVYGLDLSGTSQGAGTIGGILAANFNGTTAFYAYDANGNVTDLVGTNGEFLAQYQFDPYGNTISKTGALADVNPFRFSTKYLDAETGLYYYGYRFYMPETGRWASRDWMGIFGGPNVLSFNLNDPISLYDVLGLYGSDIHHDETYHLAILAGFCRDAAGKLADMDQSVDDNKETDPEKQFKKNWSNKNDLRKAMDPHFPKGPNDKKVVRNSEYVNKLLDDQSLAGNLELFGQMLHTYQDSWSHEGFENQHIISSAIGNPDDPYDYEYYRDPEGKLEITREFSEKTKQMLRNAYEKLKAYLKNNPCSKCGEAAPNPF